ncbi:reverse transcriptase family protein [Vibrio lentus]
MTHKYYSITQSPLYKLNSHKRLAKILGLTSVSVIHKLASKGNKNYYTSTLDCGRIIEVPLPQLARVHSRINSLLSRISVPAYLNSGVKTRSNVKNAKDHKGNRALLKLDIAKYYPSVTREQIKKCYLKSFKCTQDVAETLSILCTYNDHLPTGSTISQSLSFAVNRPIFDHIDSYAKSRSIKFTCYVDDLTFSGPVIPKYFTSYIKSYITNNRGYKCHKIRIHKADTPKLVTGVVIDGNDLKVRNEHRNTISDLMKKKQYYLDKYTPDQKALVCFYQKFQGHLFSAGQVNGRYRQQGKLLVQERKDLGIKAQNQNTK